MTVGHAVGCSCTFFIWLIKSITSTGVCCQRRAFVSCRHYLGAENHIPVQTHVESLQRRRALQVYDGAKVEHTHIPPQGRVFVQTLNTCWKKRCQHVGFSFSLEVVDPREGPMCLSQEIIWTSDTVTHYPSFIKLSVLKYKRLKHYFCIFFLKGHR